jgi:hypothetical protein
MDEKVRDQILYIRSTGLTNMFDLSTVKYIAAEFGFAELLDFLEENQRGYVNFILTGEV